MGRDPPPKNVSLRGAEVDLPECQERRRGKPQKHSEGGRVDLPECQERRRQAQKHNKNQCFFLCHRHLGGRRGLRLTFFGRGRGGGGVQITNRPKPVGGQKWGKMNIWGSGRVTKNTRNGGTTQHNLQMPWSCQTVPLLHLSENSADSEARDQCLRGTVGSTSATNGSSGSLTPGGRLSSSVNAFHSLFLPKNPLQGPGGRLTECVVHIVQALTRMDENATLLSIAWRTIRSRGRQCF